MNAQDAGNTIWALGTSGWALPGDMAALLRSLLLLALQQGNERGVSNSLSGWAKRGLALNDELAAAADAAVEPTAATMNALDVRQVQQASTASGWKLGAKAAAALSARERALKAQGQWGTQPPSCGA